MKFQNTDSLFLESLPSFSSHQPLFKISHWERVIKNVFSEEKCCLWRGAAQYVGHSLNLSKLAVQLISLQWLKPLSGRHWLKNLLTKLTATPLPRGSFSPHWARDDFLKTLSLNANSNLFLILYLVRINYMTVPISTRRVNCNLF